MNDFTLYQPTYYVFGKNTQSKVGELVKRFGGTKVLIHYGGGSVVRSGLLQQVQDSLNKAEFPMYNWAVCSLTPAAVWYTTVLNYVAWMGSILF